MIKKNFIKLFTPIFVLTLIFSGCNHSIDTSSEQFASPQEYLTQINTTVSNTNLTWFQDEYLNGVAKIKNKLNTFSTSNNASSKEISTCYSDFISYTDCYKEYDNAYNQAIIAFRPYSNPYYIKLQDLSSQYDAALKKYPNYYTGSESSYKTEETALKNELLSAQKAYDSFQANSKLNTEIYGSAYVNSQLNNLSNRVSNCQARLKALQNSWKAREEIDSIANEYASCEQQLNAITESFYSQYEPTFNDYEQRLKEIEDKY